MYRLQFFLLLVLTSFISLDAFSQSDNVTKSALTFISALSAEQRKMTIYDFNDNERFNWHFFPKTDRKGIAMKNLTEVQKKLLFSFLQQCLSETGVQQTKEIIYLEGILRQLENRKETDEYRDPGKYHIIFFGEPIKESIWGWRIEGHHLSLNFSAADNLIVAMTPAFMGSNPAIVPTGPEKGLQVLKKEEERAFQLLHSLTEDQLTKAVFSIQAPNEILTFVDRTVKLTEKWGIYYKDLDNTQQQMLIDLLEVYIGRYTKLFATQMMDELKEAGINQIRFAWAGSLQTGKAHYYQISGPTILIEYDNAQNNANHVHSVVRDLKRDFGGDLLIEHYKKSHSHKSRLQIPD